MCRKLIQVYACSHTKIVCTTACPHALETGRQSIRTDSVNEVKRSIPTLTPVVASVRYREQTSAQSRSPPASRQSIESPQAPRSILPDRPSLSRLNASPTSPKPSHISSTAPALSTAPSIAHLSEQATTMEPNYCAYDFPHNLPRSNHPCIDCFVLPEWAHRAKRWMTWYRQDHLPENLGDVELLSGVKGLRERNERKAHEGLLNVFVDGNESAGRVV